MVGKEQRQVLPEPLKVSGVGQGGVYEIESAFGDVLAGQSPGYGGAGGVGNGDARYLAGVYRGELGFAVLPLVDDFAYCIRKGCASDAVQDHVVKSQVLYQLS